jgi:hypothetical protein
MKMNETLRLATWRHSLLMSVIDNETFFAPGMFKIPHSLKVGEKSSNDEVVKLFSRP